MNDPIARKRVNALIGDAKARFGVTYFVDPAGLIVTESVVEGFKKAMGGLWVGGTATLYETSIAFRPNALNRSVHDGDYSVEIPLSDVSDVQVRFGSITKIIDLVTDHGKLSLRCFGAEAFAAKIRERQDLLPMESELE